MNMTSNKKFKFFALTLLLETQMPSVGYAVDERPSLSQIEIKNESREKIIRSIIESSQFALFAQAQRYINQKSAGTELLIRVRQAANDGDYLNTEEFIIETNKLGLLGDLTNKIIDKIIDYANMLDPDLAPYFINVPPSIISPEFARALAERVISAGLTKNFIGVELTEREAIADREAFNAGMIHLKDYGIPTALDDYGRGLATMSFLKSIQVDRVKIDRMTLKSAQNDRELEKSLKKDIDWMRSENMEVIAEGIETVDDLTFATEMGCDGVQGYLFDSPKILIPSVMQIS